MNSYLKTVFFVITAIILLNCNKLNAQESWQPGDPMIIKFGRGDSSFTLQPWAMIRFTLAAQEKELFLNDPGTRVGFKFRQPGKRKFSLFGNIELSLRMMSTGESISLSPGNSTNENSLNFNATTSSNNQVFGLRQAYLGFDFYKFGQLTIGKQRGSYLDLAERTDISEVNSGWATYSFSPEGSDGGLTGTGRANSSITYRNIFAKRIHFAASVQMHVFNQVDTLISNISSIGSSVIIDVYKGFDVAVGYHQLFFNNNYYSPDIVYGLSSDPYYFLVGAQYKNKGLLVGVNYCMQKHGDLTKVEQSDTTGTYTITSIYSGTGLEAVASYEYRKWKVLVGINQKAPEQDENKIQSNDFGKSIVFYGLQYRPVKDIALFFEGRTENSTDANGNKLPDLNMIGVRVDL